MLKRRAILWEARKQRNPIQGKVAAKRIKNARKTHSRKARKNSKQNPRLSFNQNWNSWTWCAAALQRAVSIHGSIVCKEDRHFFQCFSGASKEWQRAAEFFLHLALRKDWDPGSEPSAFCKPMQESEQSEPKFAPPQGRSALWISSHDLGGRLKLQVSLLLVCFETCNKFKSFHWMIQNV